MNGIIKDERAVANVWIGVLVAIFGFSIFYALTYDVLCARIFNIVLGVCSAETPGAFYANLDRFRLLYNVLPFIFIFSMILWGFVHAQKKNYEPY